MTALADNSIADRQAQGVLRFLRQSPKFWSVFIIGLLLVGSAIFVLARLVSPLPSATVPGVSLSLQPSGGTLVEGELFPIDVILDSVGDDGSINDIVAVAAYLSFDDSRFEVVSVTTAPGWSSEGPNNGVSGNQIEIVVGEPSPGLSGEQVLVATIVLTVKAGAPPGKGSVVFDGTRSAVILDDGLGTNILNEVFDGDYFVGNAGLLSCSELGGDICAPNESCETQELVDDDLASVCCQAGGCVPVGGAVRITSGPSSNVDCNVPSVVITWTTAGNADGQVAYSLNSCPTCSWTDFVAQMAAEGLSSPVVATSGLTHTATLTGLAADTGYFYRVRSEAGGLAATVSTEQSFFTGCEGEITQEFEITNLNVEPKPRSAVVSWNTTKLADSLVDLFQCDAGGNCVTQNNNAGQSSFFSSIDTLSHSIRVPALEPDTNYCLQVTSEPVSGEPAETEPSSPKDFCFTTLKEDLSLNANAVLKVERDRICDEWLSCESSVELRDEQGQAQAPLCFDTALCDKLDPTNGSCINFVSAAAVNQTFTQFGPGVGSAVSTQTVDELRLLSGHTRAGAAFAGFAGELENFPDGVIEGVFPYAAQAQAGSSLTIPNGDFETQDIFPWQSWPPDADPSRMAAVRNVTDRSDLSKDLNRILEVAPVAGSRFSGTRVPLGKTIRLSNDEQETEYFVTFDARSDSDQIGRLIVQFGFNNSSRFPNYAITRVDVSSAWQRFIVGPFVAKLDPNGDGNLVDSDTSDGTQTYLHVSLETRDQFGNELAATPFGSFYIDNVSVQPILQSSSSQRIAASCRIYPSADAPSCNFFDINSGLQSQGWEGYCVEPDPRDPRRCIQWLPIDLISGSNSVLAAQALSGYTSRLPLYYCTQARGNAPYVRSVPTEGVIANNSAKIFGSEFPVELINIAGGAGWSQQSGLFTWGQTDPNSLSVLRTSDGTPLSNFREWEIEQIQVIVANANHPDWPIGQTYSMNQTNNWEIAVCQGNVCSDDSQIYTRSESPFYWKHIVSNENKTANGAEQGCHDDFSGGNEKKSNLFGVQFRFDEQGNFVEVQAGLCDGGPQSGHVELEFEVYLREWCTQVTQAVDPFGANTAWAGRIADEDYLVPGLNYSFDDDFTPFGAVVPPAPDFDPSKWDSVEGGRRDPLYVEPPNLQLFPVEPFQARAGQPYGVGTRVPKIPGATGTCLLTGGVCTTSAECPTNVRDSCVRIGEDPDPGNPFSEPGECLISGEFCGGPTNVQCPLVDDRCELPAGTRTCTSGRTGSACSVNADCEILEFGDCRDEQTGGLVGECVYSDGSIEGSCVSHEDCTKRIGQCGDGTDPPKGIIGRSECISGSKLGAECARHSECGFGTDGSPGRCTGVVPPVNLVDEDEFFGTLNNSNGSSVLSNLFARSQQVWEWDYRDRRYVSGQTKLQEQLGCSAPGLCPRTGVGWDITGDLDTLNQPVYAKAPRIDNLIVKAQGVTYTKPIVNQSFPGICVGGSDDGNPCSLALSSSCSSPGACTPIATFADGFGTISLSFNSVVNSEQLPLVRYTVDWGDGKVSEEANLKIAAQTDPGRPHLLSHTYIEPSPPGEPYIPRVQIEDNWGWCSGEPANGQTNYAGAGVTCSSWDGAPVVIVVEEPINGNQPPIADANVRDSSGALVKSLTITDTDGDGFVSVTLDANEGPSGSGDPDGDPITFEWTDSFNNQIISTLAIESVSLAVGSHTITLRVTDDKGASDFDVVDVTVLSSISTSLTMPLLTVDPGDSFFVPVQLDNPGGLSISSYSVTVNFDPTVLRVGFPASENTFTLTNAWAPAIEDTTTSGQVTISASGPVVTGSGRLINLIFEALPGANGRASPMDFVGASLNGGSLPLTTNNGGVSVTGKRKSLTILSFIASPNSGSVNLPVRFDAEIEDVDGLFPVTATLDFGDGSNPEIFVLNFPSTTLTANHIYRTEGRFTAQLTAVNSDVPPQVVSDQETIIVSSGGNQPPVAEIEVNGNMQLVLTATVGEELGFSGLNSFDPDGFITSYFWDFGDGSSDIVPVTTHIYNTPDTYVVTLDVQDNGSPPLGDFDSVTIEVSP